MRDLAVKGVRHMAGPTSPRVPRGSIGQRPGRRGLRGQSAFVHDDRNDRQRGALNSRVTVPICGRRSNGNTLMTSPGGHSN